MTADARYEIGDIKKKIEFFQHRAAILKRQMEYDLSQGIKHLLEVTKCQKCNQQGVIGFVIAKNGAKSIKIICQLCGKNLGHQHYNIQAFSEKRFQCVNGFTIIRDDRDHTKRCAISDCENIGIEYHHWAPRHLFKNEADKWPGSYLCRMHHMEWHKRTKTGPFMERMP